jgi:kinesin family member 11
MMEVEFAMRVSYLELYNEELCDLLSSDDSVKIRIYDDVAKKGSVIVQGLEEIPVRCKSDVYRLLSKGQERRKTAATLMNAQSSRSHTVFSILVHIKENGNDGEEMLKIGKLNLVDLAGSENISKAGNEKGIRTRESVNINQSLLTLGRVITALVERTPHIPYRESKLTRLLQESLGGRTKTSIIATVSPGHKDLEETLSTLDYAHRAKNIQNKPEINQRLTKKVVLKEYTEEIDKLKRDLMAAREKNGIYLATDTYNDMLYKMETQQKELNEKITLFKSLKEELVDKTNLFDECQRNLEEISKNFIIEQGKVRITEAELSKTKRNLRKTERQHEESKFLVSCHQKTEKALTDHAKQLIEVVEEASTDSHSLLQSIDRRKDVEENAISASDLLMKNLTNNILEMRHELEQLKSKHKENTNIVVVDLDENTKAVKSFSSNMTKSLKELKDAHTDSGAQLQKLVENWKKSLEDASQVDSDKLIELIKELELQQSSFHSSVNGKMISMEQILTKDSTENKAMRSQLLEKINYQNAEIDSFCIELKDKITVHCSEFNQMSTQLKTETDSQVLKLQQVKKLLDEVEQSTKRCEPIHQKFVQLNTNLVSVETETIRNFSEKNSLILGEKMGCLKNVEDSQNEMYEKLKEHVAATTSEMTENEIKTKAALKKNTDAVSAKETQLQSQLQTLQTTMSNQIKESKEKDTQKNEAIGVAVKNESSRSYVKCQEVKSLVQQTLSGIVDVSQTSVDSKLNTCSLDIDEFNKQDVLRYKSTGETPARKDYKFNKHLVATSPHDKIIKRLRMEKGLSESQLDSSIAEVRFLTFLGKC